MSYAAAWQSLHVVAELTLIFQAFFLASTENTCSWQKCSVLK